MTEERELLRHNNIIEAINNANTKEDLPNVTISTLSSFLASNLYFNNSFSIFDKHFSNSFLLSEYISISSTYLT